MKVIVFTAYTQFVPHYEIDLEIIQGHLDAGDEVIHLHCGGELLACEYNMYHNLSLCGACIGARKHGLTLLSDRIKSIPFLRLTAADRRELALLPRDFSTVKELTAFRVENFDVGYAVASSLITMLREPDPDLRKFQRLVTRFLVSAMTVYRSLQHHLDAEKVDRVYVFNGRLAIPRAVLRACQSRKVDCFTKDLGHDLNHYGLYENTTPHDLSYTEHKIRALWNDGQRDPDRRLVKAEQFFIDRANGVMQSWFSFVTGQQPGLLPHDWDCKKKNIVIFNSSEDEFVCIDETWRNPVYANQMDALDHIIASAAELPKNIHLYLRVHPNLKGVRNSQTHHIAQLRSPRLTVIPPEDPVSTYALIQHADKIVTFGSTVGIEATFWGKPSILAGPSFYRPLGGTYNPSTHEELMALLTTDLPPRDKTAALMYGYYMSSFGLPYKYVHSTGVYEATFKGVKIHPAGFKWEILVDTRWDRVLTLLFIAYTRFRVLRSLRLHRRHEHLNNDTTRNTTVNP